MISLQDYNLEVIRDFSDEQFDTHVLLIEDISEHNDFGTLGVKTLLENYLILIKNIKQEYLITGKDHFRLTKEQTVLYDLIVEVLRLCYKHSYNTSANHNDWEHPF